MKRNGGGEEKKIKDKKRGVMRFINHLVIFEIHHGRI
jgi:hypothetical protein